MKKKMVWQLLSHCVAKHIFLIRNMYMEDKNSFENKAEEKKKSCMACLPTTL